MGRMTICLPRLGETMEEARVVDWLVAPGAAFRRGDILLEVETDKTVVEVPALADGVLMAQLVTPGETVALDQPIAEVDAGEGQADAGSMSRQAEPPVARGAPSPMPQGSVTPPSPALRPSASPAARAAGRRAGIDLAVVAGTGRRGRITASDVAASAGATSDAGWADRPTGIAVHTFGSAGTPVVLLHGLHDDHRGWRDLPMRLAAAGHRVLAVDLPGHGDSSAVADNLDAAADLIARALPAGPLHLIGHSLGAAIAVRLALRTEAKVDRLILSAPAGLGSRINPDFTEGMRTARTSAALGRALALLDAGPLSQSALEAQLARVVSRRQDQAALAHALAQGGFQQFDIAGDLARLTCPVAVIFGTADRVIDWHCIANLPPRVAAHMVRGAGHLPHLAAPDLVIALVGGPVAAMPDRRNA